ncbi:MAG: helicase-related protein, partial [Spirochaetaceae bacterium]|nr:helicase-related protein [Spirochaetaceae bacterium]
TEPRRLAAVAAATRMAELERSALGDSIGYRVKGESRAGPGTRIEVVTEGILVRMIQDDPSLSGVGAVVFDEIHERSIFAELCLALVSEARALRPDLCVLAMSATLDIEALSAFLGAAVLRVPGASHPIETRYDPIADGPGFEAALAARALALSEETKGDVLVFLPGAAEIARAERELAALGSGSRGVELLSLQGSQSLAVQKRALAPDPAAPRRIILATAVAETSLTVPRVSAVVDSGLARLSRFHPRTGLNRLVTEREARDRADQRRGRAGRLGPGICLRAWPAADALSERTEPEISRSELSGLALESAVWGARGRLGMAWLSPPPPAAWESACELLRGLGALDADGSATARGRAMASLGIEPRLAALVLTGAALG